MTLYDERLHQPPDAGDVFFVTGAEATVPFDNVSPARLQATGAAVRSLTGVRDAASPQIAEGSASLVLVDEVDAEDTISQAEIEVAPTFTPRRATPEDIPAMVDLDLRSFDSVYQDYEQTEDELRDEMTEKFRKRFDLIGEDWINVLEDQYGDIHGIIMAFRTNRTPDDFVSWEDMTSGGTFEDAYDPNGDYAYVATMSASPEAAKQGANETMQLHLVGQMVREGVSNAYFESRMPGFRAWVARRERAEGRSIRDFDSDSVLAMEYAKEYAASKKTLEDGTEVARDPLLRIYDEFGAHQARVVQNAYSDGPSLNFGVIYTLRNPLMERLHLPERIAKNRVVSGAAALAIEAVSKRPSLVEKL